MTASNSPRNSVWQRSSAKMLWTFALTGALVAGFTAASPVYAQFNCKAPKEAPDACFEGPVFTITNADTKATRRVQKVANGARWGLADEDGRLLLKPVWVGEYPVSDRSVIGIDESGNWFYIDLDTLKASPSPASDKVETLYSLSSDPSMWIVWARTSTEPGFQVMEMLDDRGAPRLRIDNAYAEPLLAQDAHFVINRRGASGTEAVYVNNQGKIDAHGMPIVKFKTPKQKRIVSPTGVPPLNFDPRVTMIFVPTDTLGLPVTPPLGVIGVYPIFRQAPTEGPGQTFHGWVIVSKNANGQIEQTFKANRALLDIFSSPGATTKIKSVRWAGDADGVRYTLVPIVELPNGSWTSFNADSSLNSVSLPTPQEAAHRGALERLAHADSAYQLSTLINPTDAQIDEMRTAAQKDYEHAAPYATRYQITVDDSLIVARLCNEDRDAELCTRANAQFYASARDNDKKIEKRNKEREAWERTLRANTRPLMPDLSYLYSNRWATAPSNSGAPSADPVVYPSEVEIRRNLKEQACIRNPLNC